MSYLQCRIQYLNDIDPFGGTNYPEPARPPVFCFNTDVPLSSQIPSIHRLLGAPHKLEDCALQLCKFKVQQLDYGVYLDLESTIDEQSDELEGFSDNKKNVIVLRTQLSVRVHTCIEKLLQSTDRDLRRALFSLKQIFLDDKDLVHEFVSRGGLDCLIAVGSDADQNYQNYILRALGQVMLYVDGMNGVIAHNATVQWLYSLTVSKSQSVIKTCLKLLLLFVEYAEENTLLLLQAVSAVDNQTGAKLCKNLMEILTISEGCDPELLVYTMTLINKVLHAIPDQDLFYDVTDALEEQGMERLIHQLATQYSTDADLLEQLKMYEMALQHEDEGDQLIGPTENIRKIPRLKSEEESRKSRRQSGVKQRNSKPSSRPSDSSSKHEDRRSLDSVVADPHRVGVRSDQYSTAVSTDRTLPTSTECSTDVSTPTVQHYTSTVVSTPVSTTPVSTVQHYNEPATVTCIQLSVGPHEPSTLDHGHSVVYSSVGPAGDNYSSVGPAGDNLTDEDDVKQRQQVEVTPRRSLGNNGNNMKRRERQRTLIKEQLEGVNNIMGINTQPVQFDAEQHFSTGRRSDVIIQDYRPSVLSTSTDDSPVQHLMPPPASVRVETYGNITDNNSSDRRLTYDSGQPLQPVLAADIARPVLSPLNNGDLTDIRPTQYVLRQQTSRESVTLQHYRDSVYTPSTLHSADDNCAVNSAARGLQEAICRARESLAHNVHPPVTSQRMSYIGDVQKKQVKSETDVLWEQIETEVTTKQNLLRIADLDFSDLTEKDDLSSTSPVHQLSHYGPVLTANYPYNNDSQCPPPAPPPLPIYFTTSNSVLTAPPAPPLSLSQHNVPSLTKTKKTVKLHWKEAKSETLVAVGRPVDTIWSQMSREIGQVRIDCSRLQHLFETKTMDIKSKDPSKLDGAKKEVTLLEAKRSNAINIGLTTLPKPDVIKTAIMKMDTAVINRESIDKILSTMMPTDEERSKIQEVQLSNPDVVLGSAEQFLALLCSIPQLEARLKLWAFKLDYEGTESEIAEPLSDLKQGIEELRRSRTLKYILSALLAIGNFLNGTEAAGFIIDYLSHVTEVKDTVHKHTLLHHVTDIVIDQFPDSTDLYSELGCITRCAKIDWEALQSNLVMLENDCRMSLDNLRVVIKHDTNAAVSKMQEFLCNCVERIIMLKIVCRRVLNRFQKFLLYFGYSPSAVADVKVETFCKTISDFALEYRTVRDRQLVQREKKANQRERKKTRGKMIVDMENFTKKSVCSSRQLETVTESEDALFQCLVQEKSSKRSRSHNRRSKEKPGRVEKDKEKTESLAGNVEPERIKVRSGNVHVPKPVITDAEGLDDSTEDDMLEAVIKSVTTPSDRKTRDNRRRTRHGDRKSLRRTLKGGLTSEEMAEILSHN